MFEKLKKVFRRKVKEETRPLGDRNLVIGRSSRQACKKMSYSPAKEERRPKVVDLATGRTFISVPSSQVPIASDSELRKHRARPKLGGRTQQSETLYGESNSRDEPHVAHTRQLASDPLLQSSESEPDFIGTSRGSSAPMNYVEKLTHTLERRRKSRELAAALEKQYEESFEVTASPRLIAAPTRKFLKSPVRAVDHDPWAELLAYVDGEATIGDINHSIIIAAPPTVPIERVPESSLRLSPSYTHLCEHESAGRAEASNYGRGSSVSRLPPSQEYDIFEENHSRDQKISHFTEQNFGDHQSDAARGPLATSQQKRHVILYQENPGYPACARSQHPLGTRDFVDGSDDEKHESQYFSRIPYTIAEKLTGAERIDTAQKITSSSIGEQHSIASATDILTRVGPMTTKDVSDTELINDSILTTNIQDLEFIDAEFAQFNGCHFEDTLSPVLPLIKSCTSTEREPSLTDLFEYLKTYRKAFHLVNAERDEAVAMAAKFLKQNRSLRRVNNGQVRRITQLTAVKLELQDSNDEQSARLEHLAQLFAKHDETSRKYTDIIHKQAAENKTLKAKLASMNYQHGIARIQSREMEAMQQSIMAVRAGAATDVFSLVDYKSPYEGRTNLFFGSAISFKSARGEESITF